MAKLTDDKKEIYKKWKSLVNMSYGELKKFYESKEGKEAGLSSSEAKQQGIDSGRESARWIMKMKTTTVENWTPAMWKWASKQISFISRMSGNKGGLYDDKGNKTRKHTSLLIWGNNPEKFGSGGRTIAQTPAPKKDRVYGSKVNPKGSASSEQSAKEIKLDSKTLATLTNKLKEFKETHNTKKVSLNDLKAVYRRGLGAYSKSHRPTISGGKPNTRNAWAMARVNAFLRKASGEDVKDAYVQDDDLLKYENGGEVDKLIGDGIVELKMYDTTNEHSKSYGFDAQKPLYIQSIIVVEEHRGKGIGSKVMKYILDHANKNGHDVIFGHITQKAEPNIDIIKSMLQKSGFNTIEGNNDFYKIMYEHGGTSDFGKVIAKSSRFRPYETIIFDPPLVGENGAKLVSYTWAYEWTEDWNKSKGEPTAKRISDWTQAEISADTGRDIVHKYTIVMPDGSVKTVSSDSVPVLLGYYDKKQNTKFPNLATASKTLAKQKLALSIIEAKIKEKNDAIELIKSQAMPHIEVLPPNPEGQGLSAVMYTYVMGDAKAYDNNYNGKLDEERVGVVTDGYIRNRLTEMGLNWYISDNRYDLKNRIARQERKIQNILENKMEDGGNTNINTMKTPIEIILEAVKSYQEEIVQKWVEKVKEESKEELRDWMIEDMRFSLVMDLVKAIGNYLEPTDVVHDLRFSRDKSSIVITCEIEREGQKYAFSTDMIYAGGYNIQRLHLRYIVHTKLPHKRSNPEYDKLNEQYKKMTKAQKIREEISYAENAINKYTLKMNEAKENSRLSDAEVEKISREDDPKRWEYSDWTWDKIVKNKATQNFNNDENEFYRSQAEDKVRLIKSWRTFNANFKQYDDMIKREQKQIDKLNKKLSELGYNTYAEGGLQPVTQKDIDTKVHMIAMKSKMPVDFIYQEFRSGVKVEMEHTDDKAIASKIALDHLEESPIYYKKLKEMEKELQTMNPDTYLPKVMAAYANGGTIDMIYKMNTPTKEPTKLNYIQQILVRTKEFKAWFGDWERSAQNFLMDGKQNFKMHYANCSIVVDPITLEPQVVYHGTNYKEEFYQFDVTKEQGVGRPYGYFADNIEYSQNFTASSQRGQEGKEILYKCFLNIKNPFFAIDDNFYDVRKQAPYWLEKISGRILYDRTGEVDADKLMAEISLVYSQIGKYLEKTYATGEELPFWLLMARDTKKDFKYFLMSHGYDGVRYAEEFSGVYDVNNPRQFTKAWTIFDASQVKLADGRNIDFNPMIKDIRYETGGETTENMEHMEQNTKAQVMRSKLGLPVYAEGGHVNGDGKNTDNAKDGGYFKGRSHAEGGIKAINKDTGQLIEVEGNEVIINKRSVADNTKREFEGEMLTNKEILSKINQMGGGVAFANGGEINAQNCKCNGKKYKFGGNLVPDYDIVKQLSSNLQPITEPLNESVSYVDGLIQRMYQK